MTKFEGKTIVITLTSDEKGFAIDVGCKSDEKEAPKKNGIGCEACFDEEDLEEYAVEDGPCWDDADDDEEVIGTRIIVKKLFAGIPESAEEAILHVPSYLAVRDLKDRITSAFSEIYVMDRHETECLFDSEDVYSYIEKMADIFWQLSPEQCAVAINRRLFQDSGE